MKARWHGKTLETGPDDQGISHIIASVWRIKGGYWWCGITDVEDPIPLGGGVGCGLAWARRAAEARVTALCCPECLHPITQSFPRLLGPRGWCSHSGCACTLWIRPTTAPEAAS